MPAVLISNDFPPKVGGIQNYLWELWCRQADGVVLTSGYSGAGVFDTAAAPLRIIRRPQRVLWPTRSLRRSVQRLVADVGASFVTLDPTLPLGAIGPRLGIPYLVVVHGAELTLPGRLPGTRQWSRRILQNAAGVIAAGTYPAAVACDIAGTDLLGVQVPPGVDTEVFVPVDDAERAETRRRFGIDPNRPMVLGLSRLVPRKGFDVLIDAVAQLDDSVQLVIGGTGRDHHRLERRVEKRGITARTHFLGRIDTADLSALYACADVFAMLCRDRWSGLEAEGFGIVFLEAAACGVPVVAGRSGGSHEAVLEGETGFVVDPKDASTVTAHLNSLLSDDELRGSMGKHSRERALREFSYDQLAAKLSPIVSGDLSKLGTLYEG